jgi:poly(A) polymerase
VSHPRFRAAYDFLLLRAEAGEVDSELAEWWTSFQEVNAEERNRMSRPPKGSGTGQKRRRRRRRKPSGSDSRGE